MCFNRPNCAGGLVTDDFRSRHTVLLLHIWIVNSRLIKEGKRGLSTQECLFDEFWDETTNRIRSVGVPEMSVNKRLLEVQKYSWQVCTELDGTFANKTHTDTEKLDNIAGIMWREIYNRRDEVDVDHVVKLARYVKSLLSYSWAIPTLQFLHSY